MEILVKRTLLRTLGINGLYILHAIFVASCSLESHPYSATSAAHRQRRLSSYLAQTLRCCQGWRSLHLYCLDLLLMQIQSLVLGGRDCANPATGPWVHGRGTKLAMASWKQIRVNVRNGIMETDLCEREKWYHGYRFLWM